MCGIAGIVADVPPGEHGRNALAAMRDAQQHRGPDDAGVYWNAAGNVGLANCRLSIRDLSDAARMPMCAEDVCITYNGEIYNAEELRAQLQQRGHQFRTHSDTEVILRGYLEWHTAIVPKLRGMFAFGIYDGRQQIILIARDALGIKPLYYTRTAPFCFASEVRAVVASRLVSTELDERALSSFLQLGSIPAPSTIYRDVAALLPGHYAVLRQPALSQPDLSRYWMNSAAPRGAAVEDVRNALEDAVASHMVADVPVGAFLSGGLDSSVVVALAAHCTSAPMVTCSIAFETPDYDESSYARAVAATLGTLHYEQIITREDFFSGLPEFFDVLDQPTIDGFNTYFVSRTARDAGLKVVLSGLGGDELFGGYPSFRGVPRMLRALRTARPVAGAIAGLGRADRWRKVAEAAGRAATPASAYLIYRALFTERETSRLLGGTAAFDAVSYVQERAGPVRGSLRAWVSRAELSTYTSAQLLRDSDVMSMAHSLELRVPLLDIPLLETVAALTPEQRFAGRGIKPLLHRIMRDRLPEVVAKRTKRQGFTFPLQSWLRHSDARPLWQWDAPVMRRFDQQALSELQQGFRTGRTHWSRVWAIIALNQWSERTAHA